MMRAVPDDNTCPVSFLSLFPKTARYRYRKIKGEARMENSRKYDDILNLPHPVSQKRSRMTNYDRAAQFSPFAALTGYEGVIQETARLTDTQIELDEGGKALLDEKLQELLEQIQEQPRAVFTCYQPDERKLGGAYVTLGGQVKKIDPVARCILLTDGSVIPIHRIYGIELP